MAAFTSPDMGRRSSRRSEECTRVLGDPAGSQSGRRRRRGNLPSTNPTRASQVVGNGVQRNHGKPRLAPVHRSQAVKPDACNARLGAGDGWQSRTRAIATRPPRPGYQQRENGWERRAVPPNGENLASPVVPASARRPRGIAGNGATARGCPVPRHQSPTIRQTASAPTVSCTVVWFAPPLGLSEDRSVTSQTRLPPRVNVSV